MLNMEFLLASNLDDPDQFKPEVSLYVSRAVSWDAPNPYTVHFEEMPPGSCLFRGFF